MNQTEVVKREALRLGSCKVEIGETLESLVNIGALDGDTSMQEQWEKITRMSANAGKLSEGIKPGTHKATIAGNWLEIDLANLALLRGGIDQVNIVAGAPVNGHVQTVLSGLWHYDRFIPFDHQSCSAAKITPTSVAAGTDGALVLGTDYYIVQNAAGVWGIAIPDSVNVTTEAQNIAVTYNYTPAASIEFSTGGAFEIEPRVVRLTNTNEADKTLVGIFYKGHNSSGLNFAFKPDADGNYLVAPFQIECECDESRPAKDQLFKLVDSQGV